MDESLKTLLHADEKVLWEGKAEPFTTMDKTNKPLFLRHTVIGLGIFAVVTGLYMMMLRHTGAAIKPGILLVVLGVAALTPIRFLTDAAKIRKLRYVATDRRLMVVSEGAARSVTYGRIDRAAFRTDADGVTSLLCGEQALAAKENKRREIAVIGMVGGDRAGEDRPIESFGFYALSKKDISALRGVLKQQCPALNL